MLDLSQAFAAFPILETERCILRAPTFEDTPDLLRIWSDAQVSRYLGRPPMTSRDQADQHIQMLHADFEQQIAITWAITNRSDGCLIGTIVLMRILLPHHR